MERSLREYQFRKYLTCFFLIRNYIFIQYLNYLQNLSEKETDINFDSSSTQDNELLYQGRRYDTESNLYYYRARYYDPILGRFLSTDPMGYKDSMNLYQAFNMNGYNFVDPLGLSQWKRREINIAGTDVEVWAPDKEEVAKGRLGLHFSYQEKDGEYKNITISQEQAEEWAFQAKIGNPIFSYLFREFYGISASNVKSSAFKLWLKSLGRHSLEIAISALGSIYMMAEANVTKYATKATINPHSKEVVLGKYSSKGLSYHSFADERGSTFFYLKNWREVSTAWGEKNMWSINRKFLLQQVKQGKTFLLTHDPSKATGYFLEEVKFLTKKGYKFVKYNEIWKAVK